jgi:hypothetical protein
MSEIGKEEIIEMIPNVLEIIHDNIKDLIEAGPNHEDGLIKLLEYMKEVIETTKGAFENE